MALEVDGATALQAVEGLAEGLVADAERLAQVVSVHGAGAEGLEDAVVQRILGGVRVLARLPGELEPGWVQGEAQAEWLGAGVGAMLDVELQALLPLEHVEAGVDPGVEVTRAPEGLARLAGTGLPDVVDEADGDLVVPLGASEEVEA